MISLSMRGLTATAAMVVTVPSASSRTGTDCLTALAAVTPTTRWSPRDACAAAFCDDEPFQKKIPIPARASPATAPAIHVRFCMRCRPVSIRCLALPILHWRLRPPSPPSSTGSCSTLPHRLARLSCWENTGYPNLLQILLAIREIRACWLKSNAQTGPCKKTHAHRHLERQFGQTANRESDRLARRTGTRHRLPAGDQDR